MARERKRRAGEPPSYWESGELVFMIPAEQFRDMSDGELDRFVDAAWSEFEKERAGTRKASRTAEER